MTQSVPIIIDLTYFYSLTDGDKSFEKILLKCSVEEVDTKIEGLRSSFALNNSSDIRAHAHSLISLSAIVGIPQIEEWSRKIAEKMIDGIVTPEFEILITSILSVWPNAKNEIIKTFKSAPVNP